jgi:hypothetical protein
MISKASSPARILPAPQTAEGDGFIVRRPFPVRGLDQIDPFLMLDEFGPIDVPPGSTAGFPDHPHKGFEIITYNLAGEGEHWDSHGNHGVLGDGDVQWMTAGSGLVHSEMPSEAFKRTGGRRHGFQMWVNIPRAEKAAPPRYLDVKSAAIPVADLGGGSRARVISGEAFGLRGPVSTVTPWTYVHLTLAPGGSAALPVDPAWTSLVYVFRGAGRAGASEVSAGHLALFHNPQAIGLENPAAEPLEALLLSARPVREPMARYGPFVMNTRDEIVEAFNEYKEGRFGTIKPVLERTGGGS